jgi:hypothetical protein
MLHENIAREEAQLQKLARVGSPQAIQMLRQYAQTHQDDAIRLSLANQAVNDAKEMHSKALAMLSGQQPPTVAQQVVQSIGGQGGAPMPPPGGPQGPMPPQGMPMGMPPPGMQMPPPAPPAPQMPPPSGPGAAPPGISGLPAPNMEQMADGGIAGYADGGEIRMADGTPPSMFRDPGYDPWKRPPTIAQLYGDAPTFTDAELASSRRLDSDPVYQGLVSGFASGRIRPSLDAPGSFVPSTVGQGALNIPTAAQLRGAVLGAQGQAPYKPPSIGTPKAPAVPDIVTPTLVKTEYDVGDKPTVAAIKGQVGQLADSSDLMNKVETAQADLRRQGREATEYYEKNKPTKNLFSETVARLDKEDALGANKKEQAQGMALLMAGFKMMESPYGGRGIGALLRNVGAGAKAGAENYSSAIDKLETAADKRNQQRTTIEAARDAAERGDFATKMGLMQHGQQLSAQANALGVSAAQDLFKVNADIGTKLLAAAETQHNTNKNVAAQLGSEERRAQFSAEAADRRAMFGAKMEMLKTQYEQAGANARAMAPSPEMRMALALGGNNLEAGLRKAAEISAGKTDLAKLYVQSKAEYDAKNPMGGQPFISPQEFVSLYNQVSAFRSPPAATGSPTGKVFQ